MDNLLQTIKALYVQISDRDLLRLVMCQRDSRYVLSPIDRVLTRMLQNDLPSYTIDQIENVKSLLLQKQTPLDVLLNFASKALYVSHGKPVCKYNELMRIEEELTK